jgi:hypothetical protein
MKVNGNWLDLFSLTLTPNVKVQKATLTWAGVKTFKVNKVDISVHDSFNLQVYLSGEG